MGSLLKEYLDDSEDQDDTSNPLDNDGKQYSTGENQISVNNEAHSEDCLNEVNVDEDHACDVNKGEQDLQSNNVNDESSAKQHFKNVVAIVDPPRSGLHPVVSDFILIFPAYYSLHLILFSLVGLAQCLIKLLVVWWSSSYC